MIAGIVVGNLVNMGIVTIGPSIIPLPEGADMSTAESIGASMDLLKPVNYLPPFLAHALGTLVGTFTAAKLAASHNMKMALGLGGLFLLGGIGAAMMIPAPTWFVVLDLLLAYIPMGYLGGMLAGANKAQLVASS